MRLSTPRVTPLERQDWTPETAEVMKRFERPESPGGGKIANIFQTLAHHPALLRRWTVFGNHILYKSSLPAREREVVILRVGWLCRAEYEWAQHVVIGKREGLTDDDIDRIAIGPGAEGLGAFDEALLQAADELHRDSIISDQTWSTLAKRYSTEQLLDLVFTIGQYTLVSMALNTLGVQLDDGLEGFPADASETRA